MTCTCSPSILDPLCPVREHAVMAKAVAVTRDFLGQKKMAVSFAPAVIIPIDFSPPPYVPQAVRLDWKNCTCTSIAADPLCPIEEHRALAAAESIGDPPMGDGAQYAGIKLREPSRPADRPARWWSPCTCTSIAADPLCPIEEHRALAAAGDGQPFDENPAHPIEQLLRAGTLPDSEKP